MKKITRCALAIGIIFSSCQKEANFARNWGQPVDMNDPTGVCVGGSVSWYPGISDEECINKIKTFDSYDPNKPLFLDPSVYDLNQTEESEVHAPNPDYLGFPHHISSMSDKWGWDYYHEMKQLKSELGAEGMQIFLDKYCQGDSTLGMKLNKNF